MDIRPPCSLTADRPDGGPGPLPAAPGAALRGGSGGTAEAGRIAREVGLRARRPSLWKERPGVPGSGRMTGPDHGPRDGAASLSTAVQHERLNNGRMHHGRRIPRPGPRPCG